jgi:hypothetical protein
MESEFNLANALVGDGYTGCGVDLQPGFAEFERD